MTKARLFLAAVVVAAAVCSGCGRALVTTTIDADGAYSRNLQLTAAAPSPGSMMSGPTLQQCFDLPAGAAWTTSRVKAKDNVTFTAIRRFAPGEADANDLSVIAGKGDLVESSTSVKQVSPGIWEYREVLHWSGPVDPSQTTFDSKEELADIKKALPPEFATDANALALGKAVTPRLINSFFGPPRPLLFETLGNQDLTGKLLEVDICQAVDDTLKQQFGDKMTAQERINTIHNISNLATVKLDSDAQNKSQSGPDSSASSGTSGNDGSLASLTFVLRPPGKVVSSNGIYNEYTGEVFWGFYPVAASGGDVVLTADYEAVAKAAAVRPLQQVVVASATQH